MLNINNDNRSNINGVCCKELNFRAFFASGWSHTMSFYAKCTNIGSHEVGSFRVTLAQHLICAPFPDWTPQVLSDRDTSGAESGVSVNTPPEQEQEKHQQLCPAEQMGMQRKCEAVLASTVRQSWGEQGEEKSFTHVPSQHYQPVLACSV